MTHDPVDARQLKSDLTLSVRDEVIGFVYDLEDLSLRLVVEILADGLPIGLYRADGFVEALGQNGVGDGCYGFVAILPASIALGANVIEARLANSGEAVGSIVRPHSLRARRGPDFSTHVHWAAGLRFEGWLEESPERPVGGVKALVDGRVVAEAMLGGWAHIARGGGFVAARSFQLDLPPHLADGKARRAEILGADGVALHGSPCAFVAYEDGIAALADRHAELASETMRAQDLGRLFPQSWPLVDVVRWQSRFPNPRPSDAEGPPIAVVLVGENGVEGSLDSLNAQVQSTWIAACLPDRGKATTFAPYDLQDFIEGEAAVSQIVVFCPAGTRLAPEALGLFRDALSAAPHVASAYCDLLMPGKEEPWPLALPAFDYERCLEQGYCGLVFAMRRDAVLDAIRGASGSLVRLFGSQFDKPIEAGAEPLHVPLFLASPPIIASADLTTALAEAAEAHFRNKHLPVRISASAATFPAIRVSRTADAGVVSIIIPTRNRGDLLTTCLTSIEETLGDTECEVLIADNGTTDKEALAVIASAERQGIKIVRVPGAFNFSRINNQAAAVATGRYLLLLNNDVEALEAGWLEEMVGRIAEPDVGAVGPLLLWPSGIVQHAGVVVGPNFSAAYALGDRMSGEPGYGGLLEVAHECSAVTAACLLTRRDLYMAHGGLDEHRFAIDYNDVDYCLKLRASGFRIILTPHAKLRHAESSTRGRYERPDQKDRYARELDGLRSKWGEALGADPYYNPNLSLSGPPYSGLAWPPRSSKPRQPQGCLPRDLPPGT